MSTPSFEEIVKAWVLDYDERLPTDRRERREALITLLGNLNDHGYGKEEFNTSRKEKIVRSCVNPNHKDKNRLKKWISMVVNDLDSAISIYYGTVKIRRDVVTPEMSAKLEKMEAKAEESRSNRRPDSPSEESKEDPDKPLDLDGDIPLDIDSAVKEVMSDPDAPKPFEITDEMLDEIDEPKINWDEDFSKRFGLDDDDQS